MANVGRGPLGSTLIGQGNSISPTFASVGTGSGLTQHGVLIAEGNNAFAATSSGTAGQVLTSNGASSDPSFQSISAAGAITTITGNSGGAQSPSSGNFNVLGTGSITIAGTANTETVQLTGLTNHAVLVGAGTATITKVGPSATAGQVLQSGGSSADPSYSTATYPSTSGTTGTILTSNGTNFVNTTAAYPSTTTANRILYSNSNNFVTELLSANNSILSTTASGVPSFGTSLTNDYTFTSSTAAVSRNVTVSNTDNTSGSSAALFTASTGGTSSGDCYSRYAVGSTRSYAVGIDNSDTQSFKIVTAASGTVGPSGASIVTRIDNNGNVTLPLNCCVQAYVDTPTTDVTGDGTIYTIIFDSETFDIGNNFNTTTGTFTAPVAGKYLVAVQVSLAGLLNTHTSGVLSIVSTNRTFKYPFGPFNISDATGQCYVSATQILNMAATDTMTVTIQVSNGTKVVDIVDQNFGDFTNVSISLIS